MMTTKRRKPKVDPELPERVRALRKRLDLSQDKLSERGGMGRHEVSKIENGERQLRSFPARQQLAKAFSLSIEDLSAYLDGSVSLETIAHEIMHRMAHHGDPITTHGDLPGWETAEQEVRLHAQVPGYELMGARLMPVLRPPKGAVNATYVIAVAWLFRYSASEEEMKRAIEAERREHPTSSAPPSR